MTQNGCKAHDEAADGFCYTCQQWVESPEDFHARVGGTIKLCSPFGAVVASLCKGCSDEWTWAVQTRNLVLSERT